LWEKKKNPQKVQRKKIRGLNPKREGKESPNLGLFSGKPPVFWAIIFPQEALFSRKNKAFPLGGQEWS